MSKTDFHIVIVDPGSISSREGVLYLPERSYLGYKAYKDYLESVSQHITFSVVALEGIVPAGGSSVDHLHPFEPSTINLVTEDAATYLRNIAPGATVHALYKDSTRFLVDLPHRVVYLVEFTPGIRRGIYRAHVTGGFWKKAVIDFSLMKKEYQDRKFLRRASALQFNGSPAAQHYRRLAKSSIVFFDHRVDSLPEPNPSKYGSDREFNIGFSGRLDPMKGSRYLAHISQKLYKTNPFIKFYIMGDGSDRSDVLERSAPNLIYKGFMEYRAQWVPFVQKNISLMVLPHVQGDPSMTYFESLGQGVPVVAFENETSTFLNQEGVGWTVPRADVDALVEILNHLALNRDEVGRKSEAALRFMSSHLYTKTVARRMDHLISISQKA
ncbi:glycosyltransferase [Rothia nasisuis]|uniref:glycosyltransferase n=1 Tax=Rothia nasisuis TaxID=2109647 RepID=UPI001F28D690|nr:glycosyltransferase [Rothia nasisuis]